MYADDVLDPWKSNFEEGELRHDLVLNRTKYELSGTYTCEAINQNLGVYRFNTELHVIGRFHNLCFWPITMLKLFFIYG